MNNEEAEINLKDLLFVVLYHWRSVLVIGLVFAVLLGAYKEYSYRFVKNDEGQTGYDSAMEAYNIKKSQYDHSVTAYELSMQSYNDAIDNLTQEVQVTQKYISESPKMQLDPYAYYGTELRIYIDNGYQILPQNTYQDTDTSTAIIAAYITELTAGDFREGLSAAIGIDQFYLDDIYTVISGGDGFIYMSLIGPTEDFVTVGADYISSFLPDVQKTTMSIVGNFDAKMTDYGISVLSSSDTATYQEDKKAELTDLLSQLIDAKTSLASLTEPDPFDESMPVIWHKVVKMAVIGFIVGAVLMAVWAVCKTILCGKVLSESELRARSGLALLGTYTEKSYKGFDKIFRNWDGRTNDADYVLIAANLKNQLSVCGNQGMVLLTGTANCIDYDRLRFELSKCLNAEIVLNSGNNMLKDAETLSKLSACSAVILAEACGNSTYDGINQEMSKIAALSKPILGVIVKE